MSVCPSEPSYPLLYAQCLLKAGLYPEAAKACLRVDSEQYRTRLVQLQAAIRYEEDDLSGCVAMLENTSPDDPDTAVTHACIKYKQGQYEEAKTAFLEAASVIGSSAQLSYNVALCYYAQKAYAPASKTLQDIIERGVRSHPELSVGSATDGVEVRSVGNTTTLRETALVEAFNLKAAIQYNVKDLDAAREALSDMPPRSEEELDSVTLHNSALLNMENDPTTGFKKLNFMLTHPPFPPETFGNLLLLYIKYGCYDLAADIMAQNAHLTFKYLTPELYEFLDATICVQTSPEEAYRKYDLLTGKHIEALRRHTKAINDARLAHNNEGIKAALKLYDETLERYIPVLMGMARIYWDRGNYPQVEKIFRQSAEFASEHEIWKLNVAHTFFMQDGKYKEAIRYYEPLVKKHWDSLLDVTAIVLANICVAYIMTNQNEEAEEIMRR
jgi:tetratricopeptide repeat protein 30